MTVEPTASIVIVSYRGASRLDLPLRALTATPTMVDFEIVVVLSGADDDAVDRIRSDFPAVRLLEFRERLRPGPARNRGIAAARGGIIAFLPDDGIPEPKWLERRVTLHQAGYQAVGGAIVNAFPESWIASSVHLLEYSSLLPYNAVLEAQAIPHCLSFTRDVFDHVGVYPEDTITGEDTLFNQACKAAGASFAFSSEIRMLHRGATSLRANLRHAFEHGRGLMQCSREHGLPSGIGVPQRWGQAMWRGLVRHPWCQMTGMWRHLSSRAPQERAAFVRGLPVIWLCLVATGAGAITEWTTEFDRRTVS